LRSSAGTYIELTIRILGSYFVKRFSRVFALSFFVPSLVAVCLTLTGVARSEAAANGLTLAEACAADGTASLYFGWQGVNPAAKELWLDVISYGDGYRPAAVVSAGPLSPNARSYDNWHGFGAGGTYYVVFVDIQTA